MIRQFRIHLNFRQIFFRVLCPLAAPRKVCGPPAIASHGTAQNKHALRSEKNNLFLARLPSGISANLGVNYNFQAFADISGNFRENFRKYENKCPVQHVKQWQVVVITATITSRQHETRVL